MIIGQSLLCEPGTTLTCFGPWFPRGANAGTFLLEVILASGGAFTVTVTIQHKNSEDPDSGLADVGTLTFVGPDPGTGNSGVLSGFKELVRYKYEITTEEEDPAWIHLRMNPPIWQPN